MRRPLIALIALAALAAPLGGCASKEQTVTHGETEGSYLDLDGLKYQVQISRALNPASNEDRYYLRGLSKADAQLQPDEAWFGVFMRVENTGKETRRATSLAQFEIADTTDTIYRPLTIDSAVNSFSYQGGVVPSRSQIPLIDSPPFNTPSIGGSLILFKVRNGSFDNRPLELTIRGTVLPQQEVTVDLDV